MVSQTGRSKGTPSVSSHCTVRGNGFGAAITGAVDTQSEVALIVMVENYPLQGRVLVSTPYLCGTKENCCDPPSRDTRRKSVFAHSTSVLYDPKPSRVEPCLQTFVHARYTIRYST